MMKFLLISCLFLTSYYAIAQSGSDSFKKGKTLYEAQKYTEALEKFDAALVMDYQENDIYILKGNCFYMLDDKKNALVNYNLALSIDPKSARAFYNRAAIHNDFKEFDAAIQDYTSALEVDHNYFDAYKKRGALYYDLGDMKNAVRDFEKYITFEKQDDTAYGMLGVIYGEMDNKKSKLKGIEYLGKAISLNADDADYYYFRGYFYMDIYDNSSALTDLMKATELRPGYGDAYMEIGNIYQRTKDFEKQVEYYSKAINAKPENGKYYYWRGYAKLEHGEKDSACEDLKKALELGFEKAKTFKSVCELKGRVFFQGGEYGH